LAANFHQKKIAVRCAYTAAFAKLAKKQDAGSGRNRSAAAAATLLSPMITKLDQIVRGCGNRAATEY
jgi:hypothetical protein